jgi:hypothetical protein
MVCVSMVAALGCSQMVEVRQEFDEFAPFENFKTYAWMPLPEDERAVSGKWMQADEWLRVAMDREMMDKGFTKVDVNPDVFLAYSFGAADRISGPVDYSVPYKSDYKNAEVWHQGGGILIIDIVNAKTERLAWRGIADAAINVDPTPEMMEKNINRAVEKTMDQYPPKTRKS